MANPLGGQKDNISREGMNIYVKQKEIAITVGIGSKLFEIWMWLWGVIPAIICFAAKTPIYFPCRQLLPEETCNNSGPCEGCR